MFGHKLDSLGFSPKIFTCPINPYVHALWFSTVRYVQTHEPFISDQIYVLLITISLNFSWDKFNLTDLSNTSLLRAPLKFPVILKEKFYQLLVAQMWILLTLILRLLAFGSFIVNCVWVGKRVLERTVCWVDGHFDWDKNLCMYLCISLRSYKGLMFKQQSPVGSVKMKRKPAHKYILLTQSRSDLPVHLYHPFTLMKEKESFSSSSSMVTTSNQIMDFGSSNEKMLFYLRSFSFIEKNLNPKI